MKLVILHLSDIHFKHKNDNIISKSNLIASAMFSHIDESDVVVILVSGDIAFSGTAEQYNIANDFILGIKSKIKSERDILIEVVLCPGNHDCDFKKNPTREFLLKSIQEQDVADIDYEIFESCTSHQQEYFKFADKFSDTVIESDRLWVTKQINVKHKKIIFDSINLSWASRLHEKQGTMVFPFSKYAHKKQSDADLRISIMHHPLNWMSQSSYRDFRQTVRTSSDIIFTGHEHESNAINHDDIESGKTMIIEGGVLQDGTSRSSFGILSIDFDEDVSNYFSYDYSIEKEMYLNENTKPLFNFDKKERLPFNFKKGFSEKLDDCGGYFKHSNTSNLKLSDIFVYPNVKYESGIRKSIVKSSNFLTSLDSFSKGIFLSGEDNIGSTSLLYRLIQEYFSSGYMPVLLRGVDIKQSNESNINLQIERALVEQYDDNLVVDKFKQIAMNKKVILIDDFEETKIRSEISRAEVINYLSKRFDKIIITVDSMFEVGEITKHETNSVPISFEHYKLEQFGYLKRTELISKWYSVGRNDHETEGEMIGKCNSAENLMDIVMDKSLISSNPIFLLTFLQSIDAGQSGQLNDSALGHYYKFLLTQSYLDTGVGADNLGQELDYAMHLAYYFYKRQTYSISIFEFRLFNKNFSDIWQETDFDKKEKLLINARVLMKVNDEYEFRYSYNYFYLLGMYLSQNILNDEVQVDITRCIEHLYVKKNANTILFLAHHSTSDNILVLMKNAADELFKENLAADFNGGCTVVHDLIKHAPELVYNNNTPQENRIEISKKRDSNSVVEQNDLVEVDPKTLDLTSKLMMLFKTIEILGQIIKSNPTKFERVKKVEILKSIFNAPLRALQDFYNFLEENPSSLIKAINHDLSYKSKSLSEEDRERVARLAVSGIIQTVTSSFIMKTGQIVNSDSLMPDIPTAISFEATLALELIGLSIVLDNHKPLQRRKIKEVIIKCNDNIVAKKVIDIMIFNRLNMFKTSEQDMQWLQSELHYDLTVQHQIGYNQKNKIAKF